jgi:glutamate dehydrogenase (NAD(P)+)
VSGAPLLETHWVDPETGAEGWLVIDRLVDGTAGGGIRMRPGVTREEVRDLARVMTRKLRVLNMPAGGAKAGIDWDPESPEALAVLEGFLRAHRPILAEMWSTSEDLGTHERDILAIVQRLGLTSSVHASLMRQPDPQAAAARLQQVMSLRTDGMEIGEATTGYGVAEAAARALSRLGRDPRSATAVVQGFGTVGGGAALYLRRFGIRVVGVADRLGLVYRQEGVDVPALLAIRDAWGVMDRERLPAGHVMRPGDDWWQVDADVLVPAAVAGSVEARVASGTAARLVVEAANLPVTPEADAILHRRGIVVVPDFVANAGGAGAFAAALAENVEPTAAAVLAHIGATIGGWTERILDEARRRDVPPREAAQSLLDERGA